MIIITKELFEKKPEMKHDYVAKIERLEEMRQTISCIENKNTEIIIYDLGSKYPKNPQLLEVVDHINKTGINPIIGMKKIEFKDISKLYGSKNGITTTCCGKDLNLNHKNPSHFLCVFSVLVFYLGFTNISGFIININYEK